MKDQVREEAVVHRGQGINLEQNVVAMGKKHRVG